MLRKIGLMKWLWSTGNRMSKICIYQDSEEVNPKIYHVIDSAQAPLTYEENGYDLNDKFLYNLELYTDENKFNYTRQSFIKNQQWNILTILIINKKTIDSIFDEPWLGYFRLA